MNNKNVRVFKHGFSIVLSLVFVFIVTSTGCEVGGYEDRIYELASFNDFLDALKDMKYKPKEVREKNEVQDSYFSVSARYVNVGDEVISVFEFEDAETASLQAETISKDGYTIADNEISWTDEPHFYQNGNLIVGYIGKEEKLLFDLYAIFGNPITE